VDAVLNWIWQGGIVALATAVSLRMLDTSRAQARYAVVWVALLSVLALPAVPLLWAYASAARDSGDIPGPVGPVLSMPVGWWTSGIVVLSAWALWSAVYAARLAAAILALQRAKTRCLPFPAVIEQRLHCWTRVSIRGRLTRMVLSDRVRYAAVLGWGSPVIAVAPSLLQQLTDDELDRVVVHEWAHVQRHDDFARLVQLLIRAIVGWHPAVWWLDRQLDIEREMACDETAVEVTGSAKAYAACLVKLASLSTLRLRPLPVVAVLSSSGLRRRMVRILSGRRATPLRSWTIDALGAGISLSVLAIVVGGWRLIEARPAILPDVVVAEGIATNSSMTVGPISQTQFSSEQSAVHGQSNRARARRATAKQSPAVATATHPVGLSMAADITGATTPSVVGQRAPIVPSQPTVTVAASLSSMAPGPTPGTDAVVAEAPAIQGTTTSPWAAAADRGVALGRQSQKAATATAGFFTRFGKRIGDTF
jgi:beta-lactamase regulating signal transducer with metallopeptidase domain